MVLLSLIMGTGADGFGLPQMSQGEMLERLLSEDPDRSDKEPEIASSIGEQMLLMGLRTMPRSMRARIRDISSRVPLGNAILVGGGIGHLSAWLFDLWCGNPVEENHGLKKTPDSFIIIEEGARFGVIIDRLIRRYNAESWSRVMAKPWSEITAEVASWSAAAASLPSSARPSDIPLPVSLVIIDLPDSERPAAASSAFDILSPDGLLIVPEPEVPTGDVGVPEEGSEPTIAQAKVLAFNQWISFIKNVSEHHSISFVELSGGTLAVIRRMA
tara:strand:- start:1269 stop:2084 length:816 start_codon:yes stop_codon:yes gene_type:complete